MSTSNHLIFLIHGGASSSRMYKDVIPLLKLQGYSCLVPDLPGHGTSAAKTRPFTFAAASKSIADSLKQYHHQQQQTTNPTPSKVMLVGISLGAQSVLSFLQSEPEASNVINSALVSGASIHPPDEHAQWEMPRIPSEQAWLDIIMEDVNLVGMENLQALQNASFGFMFDVPESAKGLLPPTLAVVGEFDTPMSRRDLKELTEKLKVGNELSDFLVMKGAWHNHSMDVPEQFAQVVVDWAKKSLG